MATTPLETASDRHPGGSVLTRRNFGRLLGASALGVTLTACVDGSETEESASGGAVPRDAGPQAPTQTQMSQSNLTPNSALEMLQDGNARFVAGTPARRDLAAQVRATAGGQYPFAVVLGCIDSRVPTEVVFDQGIGDIFSARVAGNVVNGDLLGSMEFACNVAGSKAVVVLGHTSCGAVKGAIASVELGNLTGLVEKIEPAVASVGGERDTEDSAYVDEVAETNVRMVVDQIRAESPVLAGMEQEGSVAIVGAMYDVGSGEVRFL